MAMKTKYLFLLLALLIGSIAHAQFTARVTRIIDGDSIVAIDSNLKEWQIRLDAIDCPEKGQPFAEKAKQFTSKYCYRKIVAITPKGTDKYGRTLAEVTVQGEQSLNKALLAAGMAWHFTKYSSSTELQAIEDRAKAAKAGLWAKPDAVAPWVWRHMPKPATHQ